MSQTVLITGASSGIGKATAKYFLQKGWNVSATMRSPRGSAGASSIHADDGAKTGNIIYPYLDVTKPESIEDALRKTLEHFGQIDVLVNNAGYGLMGPLEGITPNQLEDQFQTNVFGVVSTIQVVLPIMRQQGKGTIVNVASIGGRLAFPLAAPYHSTKWAVEGLSEALRYELRRFNIRVKIIEPGGIKTNFIHQVAWATHPMYEDLVEQVQQFSAKLNDSLPGPKAVAKTIYRAANDRSGRLRYSPHGEAFLLLHAMLPDWLWRSLVERIMLSGES